MMVCLTLFGPTTGMLSGCRLTESVDPQVTFNRSSESGQTADSTAAGVEKLAFMVLELEISILWKLADIL
jgi:hypothetical protein